MNDLTKCLKTVMILAYMGSCLYLLSNDLMNSNNGFAVFIIAVGCLTFIANFGEDEES